VREDWTFEPDFVADLLLRHFKVHSLDGFGCAGEKLAVRAAGAVLHYVTDELRRNAAHVRALHVKTSADFLVMDEGTVAHLDLVPTRMLAAGAPTLLGVLDKTRRRWRPLLRDWLMRPLARCAAIVARQDAIEALTRDRALLHDLRTQLAEIRDLERLIARLGAGGAMRASCRRWHGRSPRCRRCVLRSAASRRRAARGKCDGDHAAAGAGDLIGVPSWMSRRSQLKKAA